MKISKDIDLLYFWNTYSQNPIPIVVISKEGKIIEYNEAMFELTGYTQEEVPDIESWMTRLYPDEKYRGKVIEISRKSRQKEIDLKRDEFIITRKDGEKRYVEFSFYNIIYEGESTDLQVIQGVDITKYKKAEEEFKKQQKFMESIYESLYHPFYVIDANDYTIKIANSACGFGSFSENQTCYELTHKRNKPYASDDTEHPCPIEIVKKTKKATVVEHVHYDKDGRSKYFEVHATPIFDSKKNVIQVIEYNFEITKRKKTEKALKEKIIELNSFINNIPDMAWLMDIESRFIAANTAYGKAVGKNPSTLINKGYEVCFGKKGGKNLRKDDMKVIKSRKQTIIEEKINIGNNIIWLETIKSPMFDNSGKVVGIVGIARNITERKKAEESLRESEEKYRNLFENLNDAAFLTDSETGIILEANKQAEVLLGCPREEIIGMHQTELHTSDNVEKYKQIYKCCITTKNCSYSGAEVIRKDGMTIPVSISCQKLTLERKCLIIYLFCDLTDRKRVEEEEKLRQQQLIQTDKLASLGEVVAGVAHEINNPNSFITYNVPLLEETWEMFEPTLKEYAATHPEWRKNDFGFEELIQDMREIIYSIRIGSERINKIVASLKDYARVNETSYKKLVNVNEIIKKTMIIIGSQVRKSVGQINISLADNLPKIQGHFQKLEQVVANLVVNSVHAIPHKEEGKISISTRYIDRLRSVLIEVEDNGDGIEPDLINRIFDPFFTTRRNEEGTGLGLSVSYSLVQEHNGIISVISKPGVGTRFTVFLPVERDVKLNIRPLILCVDDDETVLNIFKKYFPRIENMLFDTICQSKKVLEYIDEHPEVDIVISDIKMPVVNGWEILQKVKEKYPLLTVILYSGYPDELRKKDEIDVKPDYLLEKPVDFKRLELILKSIARKKL